MANKKNNSILVVLITGLIGFSIGMLGDFVKIAISDLKNYNAIKVKSEKRLDDNDKIELIFEIYKIGNKPVSFSFNFTISDMAKKNNINIIELLEPETISKSIIDYGGIGINKSEIKDGMFTLEIRKMNQYDKYRITVLLSSSDTIKDFNGLFKLNVKTDDPNIKAFESRFYDFIFKMPTYLTAIIAVIILLLVITIFSHYTFGILLKKK